MTFLGKLGVVGALMVVTVAAAAGAADSPLTVSESLGVLAFANRMPIALSPDGEWVAYTVEDDRKRESTSDERYLFYTRTGVFTEAVGCDVWITNTRSGESRNLTQGRGTSSSPVWSPDGKQLAFYSDRGGMEAIWIWDRASGQMRQLSQAIPRPFFNFQVVRWSPDGHTILAKVLPEGMSVEQAADLITPPIAPPAESGDKKGVTVQVFRAEAVKKEDTTAKRLTQDSWMNRYLGDLALIEVASGKVEHIVANIKPLGYWFSPDGKTIAYTDWKGVEENTQQPAYELVVYDVAQRRSRVLAAKAEMDYGISVSFSPDSRTLAYLTAKGDCYAVPVAGGEAQNLTPGKHSSFSNDHRAPLWDAAGQHIYLLNTESYGREGENKIWMTSLSDKTVRQVAEIPNRTVLEIVAPNGGGRFYSPDGHSLIVTARDDATMNVGFYRVSLDDGKVTSLSETARYLTGDSIFRFDEPRDGKFVVFVAQDSQHPADVWITSPDLHDARQLSHVNGNMDQRAYGKSRLIEWRGIDGQVLRGALLLPSNYQEGRRYPLIVNVYGGSYLSRAIDRFGLSGAGVDNMQILATRGYAVLMPDTPLRKGTPMSDLLKTVMPGVDRVIEMGVADPERLGIMGHSYGGYSTLSLIVQTSRFKAAVDSAGPADLVSLYGAMDKRGSAGMIGWSESGQGGMEGTPWQFRQRYIENSPIFYLDRVQTPLLIVQGELDTTVPHTQAEEIFVGLRRLGKEVVYAKYAGEDHWEGTWSAANAEDYWERVIGWFDQHLKN